MMQLATISASLRYCSRHPHVRLAIAVLLLLCLILSILIAGWWWPGYRESARLQDGIDAYRQQATESLRAEQVLKASRNAAQALSVADKKLQSTMGQSELIQSLSQLASRNHVQILSQAFEEGKSVNRHAALRLELALQGSYPSLRNYLRDLATLNAWIAVEEARFERTRGGTGHVKASLHLVTYRQSTGRKTE